MSFEKYARSSCISTFALWAEVPKESFWCFSEPKADIFFGIRVGEERHSWTPPECVQMGPKIRPGIFFAGGYSSECHGSAGRRLPLPATAPGQSLALPLRTIKRKASYHCLSPQATIAEVSWMNVHPLCPPPPGGGGPRMDPSWVRLG